jgi:hypothetical protein
MKIIKINSKKQDNGLWGMPKNCYYMDKYIQLNEKNELIRSASIIAMTEKFNLSFSIFMSNEYSFYIKFDDYLPFVITYSKYEVVNDILYQFNDNKEHNIFLRKQKLEKINNV